MSTAMYQRLSTGTRMSTACRQAPMEARVRARGVSVIVRLCARVHVCARMRAPVLSRSRARSR